MPLNRYILILLLLLTIALFVERYSFIVVVYKTSHYGYGLIFIVVALNSLFLFVIKKLRKKKHIKRLREIYSVEAQAKEGFASIMVLLSILDVLKTFFIFWAANLLPIWLFTSLLQLFIPFNILIRACCIKDSRHYATHWLTSLLILIGAIIHMMMLIHAKDDGNGVNFVLFAFQVILSVLLDSASHTIKEGLVRSRPFNQEEFNFKVSFFSTLIMLISFPIMKLS